MSQASTFSYSVCAGEKEAMFATILNQRSFTHHGISISSIGNRPDHDPKTKFRNRL